MSVRFTSSLPLQPSAESISRSIAELTHGELTLGKVTRVSSDGVALIRFPEFEARAQADASLQAGKNVFASVQKTRDETLLNLLPYLEEGDILSGVAAPRSALGRFADYELKVRLPAGETNMPAEGIPIRAQVQILGGKSYLQMLPAAVSGDSLDGRIAALRSDGGAVLDVRGTPLLARVAASLKSGENVEAAMRQIGDRVILEILPASSGMASGAASAQGRTDLIAKFLAEPQYARLLEALVSGELKIDSATRELAALLQQALSMSLADKAGWMPALARALEAILLSPMREDFIQQLSAALRDSGIFFESRLLRASTAPGVDEALSGDLKPALLLANQKISELLNTTRASGSGPAAYLEEIAARVGHLIDVLTAEQFQNIRLSPNGQIYVQLPFAEGAELDRVEIRISRQGKHAQKLDPRNVSITLVVTASKLGRIKASVSIVDGQVSCQFRASRKSVADLLDANAGMLKAGLERLNYRVAHIGCLTSNNEQDYLVLDSRAVFAPGRLDVRI